MFIIGLNHTTAPIQIREKFFLNSREQELLLSTLKNDPAVAEAFVLSTCNRIEIYLKRVDASIDGCFVLDIIARIKKVTLDFDVTPYFYIYQKEQALEHLLRVTCGLDSLVLGEQQILGQVKHAVDRAREQGTLAQYFNVLSNIAIRAGKKARHETAISCGGSSISWASITMAEQHLGILAGKKALVIGAGKMGEIALEHLAQRGVGKIYLMNRTGEKAEVLAAKYNGIAASFMDIKEILSEVDVCFCAVGAPHYILSADVMQQIMSLRQGRELVLMDISMPRNIDPAVAEIAGIHLNSIDDLVRVVDANRKKRAEAVRGVENIITTKIAEFNDKISKIYNLSDSGPLEPAETL